MLGPSVKSDPPHFCRGTACPGQAWKASDYPHPSSCVGPTETTLRGEPWPAATDRGDATNQDLAKPDENNGETETDNEACTQRDAPSFITFTYTNYRSETSTRRVALDPAPQVRYIDSPHHGPGCVLTGLDLDRNAMRDFALDHILFWRRP